METEELLKKRFRELAEKCYRNNQYTFTGFLGLSEAACFYELEKELSYVPYTLFGGSDICERVMLRFGSQEQLSYTEEFPISCLKISPLSQKFGEELGHRDFLGALMNLGIERSTLGDILVFGKEAYLFCHDNMTEFIMENLTRIRHTAVMCTRAAELPTLKTEDKTEEKIQASSLRIDGVTAKVYRLSRNEVTELFRQKKIFLNGRLCENNSQLLKEGDVISVRGYGRYQLSWNMGVSKKGKLNLTVILYGKR